MKIAKITKIAPIGRGPCIMKIGGNIAGWSLQKKEEWVQVEQYLEIEIVQLNVIYKSLLKPKNLRFVLTCSKPQPIFFSECTWKLEVGREEWTFQGFLKSRGKNHFSFLFTSIVLSRGAIIGKSRKPPSLIYSVIEHSLMKEIHVWMIDLQIN